MNLMDSLLGRRSEQETKELLNNSLFCPKCRSGNINYDGYKYCPHCKTELVSFSDFKKKEFGIK